MIAAKPEELTMKRVHPILLSLAAVGLLSAISGCSNKPKDTANRNAAIAQEKVTLVKRLADEVAKNPNSVDVAGLVEEIMNTPLDPAEYPAEATEILKIYDEKIKGKITGDPAMHMASVISRLKRS